MKKFFALVLVVLAALAVAALAEEAIVHQTVYEGLGMVEVDFLRDVQYRNLTVAVQDENGADYEVVLWETDEDDLAFRVVDIRPGLEYSYTISGVRTDNSGDFRALKGAFVVPENENTSIKKVEYDFDDDELEVEFHNRVNLEAVQVKLRDIGGTEYALQIRDFDRDGFEAYAPGLVRGAEYVLEVDGIGDGENMASAVFSFVAFDD